jgi:hypothetical protein
MEHDVKLNDQKDRSHEELHSIYLGRVNSQSYFRERDFVEMPTSIFVKTLRGKTIIMNLDSLDIPVEAVKQMIQEREGRKVKEY